MFIRFLKIIKIKYDFSLGTECIYHNDKMLRPLTEEEFAEYKKFRYPGTSSEKHIPLNVM